MMKTIRCTLLLACCMLSIAAFAQHPLDRYLGGQPTPTVIGTAANAGLDKPVDLEFNMKPGRTHELWVLNRDDQQGSSMSIFFHANTPQQVIQKRKDSHRSHFMVNCPAFAMSDTGDFCTVQEVLNSLGPGSTETFMGPVLWTSDTSVFARYYQSNWDPVEPLGSHIDMLHQSPYSMGVAWERDNIYWIFDGYSGNIISYNFQTPHDIGADDHSDGILKRYTEVKVKRVANLPSHMILDHKTGLLYIVDNGNKRILWLDTKTGTRSTNISNPYEPLEEYYRVKDVSWGILVDSGLVKPSGIDVMDGRLVVTENSNGDIIFYDLTSGKKNAEIGRVKTGKTGIAGITIAPDSTLWYVVTATNEVIRIEPSSAPGSFDLLYPKDIISGGVSCSEISDTLKWEASVNAVSYHVQVSDTGYNNPEFNFVNAVLDTVVTNLYVPYTVPNHYTNYIWRVTAKNSDGDSVQSSLSVFKTRTAPTQLVSPANMSSDISDPVSLTWALAPHAYIFRVQIATDSSFTQLIRDTTLFGYISCSIRALAPNTKYYWRVSASAEYCPSIWTETWSFTRNSLSVKSAKNVASVLIYPNPANSAANISLSLTEPTHVNISLYSILGENMMTIHNGFAQEGMNSFSADVSKLAAGVYHLRIETNAGVVTKQIIVQ